MNEIVKGAPAAGAASGLSLGDILYIVFRHKWKILLGCVLAVAAALAVPFVRPRQYASEARLYVRYVLDSKTPTPAGDNDPRIRLPETHGDSIMRTELEILTSMDLATNVVDAIGAEKLLGKGASHGDPELNRLHAAILVLKQLAVDVPKDSSVIRLTFQHRNPEIVQPVLNQLIASYIKKHAQIHAVGAFDEFLTQETDQRRSKVAQIEDELRKAKAKVGVISLEDTKHAYSEQLTKLQQALFDAEAELAERRAAATDLAKVLRAPVAGSTNQPAGANYAESVAPEKLREYHRVCALLETLAKTEQERSLMFTPTNALVREVRAQIAFNEQLKSKLETENPGLLAPTNAVPVPVPVPGAPAVDPRAALNAEMAHVSGLEERVKTLHAQLDEIHTKVAALGEVEGTITDLERSLALESTNLARFAQGLQQSQLDEKLGAGKVANISTIQEPTPPLPAPSKTRKMMAMVLLGGMAAVFGLAFVLEMYLDPSVKRPAEIESKLGLPLFISVPRLDGNGHRRTLAGKPLPLLRSPQSTGHATTAEVDIQNPTSDLDRLERNSLVVNPQPAALPALQPFSDALRDRLINFFENRNMRHKPKLVAVTSCGEGSGVSTISAGLAASLSETGDGNVLLVDMNLENGGAAAFRRGNLACGLDEALEGNKRDQALVQDKLYMVSEIAGDRLPAALPKRFKNLVPRLKTSDYDYIIFDLPPVSQISLTPRLSRFMDMVLMVVESEKTGRDVVKRASALLAESRANVGIVLNKQRRYIPRRFQQDL